MPLFLKKTPIHTYIPPVTIDSDYVMSKNEVLFRNNGDTDIFIETNFLLKPGHTMELGGFDRELTETISISFSGTGINRLDIIEIFYKRVS